MTSHRHRPLDEGKPAFIAALTITLVYAAIELSGGLWSDSLALVSDAGHMFSDALALALAAVAGWLAQRPMGLRHSYGWARAEVIGAMLNGLRMLAIIFVLVVEAVQRLLEPRLVIAGLILVSTLGLLRDTVHVLMEGVPATVDLAQFGRTLPRALRCTTISASIT